MALNEPVNAVNTASFCFRQKSYSFSDFPFFLVRMRLESLKSESMRGFLCGLKVLTLPQKFISVSGTYNIQHKAHKAIWSKNSFHFHPIAG